MAKFADKNSIEFSKDSETVPERNRMRSVLKMSPFRKKQKELFNYYLFLTQNLYELETMETE